MSGPRLTGGALGALALLAGMGPGFQQGALDRLWVCSPPMAVSGPKLGTGRHPALAEFWEGRGVAFMWLDEEGAGQDIDALAALGRRHGCDLVAVVALESSTKRVSKLLSPMAMKATVTIHALLVEVGAGRLALRRDADFSHSERVWFSQGQSEKAAVLQAVHNSIQASFGSYPLEESLPATLVPLPALASTGLFTVVEAGFVWAVGDGLGPTLRIAVAPTLDTPWEAEIQATFPDPLGGPDIVLRSGPLYGTAATLESPPLAGQGCEVVTVRLAVLGAVDGVVLGTGVQPVRSRGDATLWDENHILDHDSACLPVAAYAPPSGAEPLVWKGQFTLEVPTGWTAHDGEGGPGEPSSRGPITLSGADLAGLGEDAREEALALVASGALPALTIWRHDSTETMSCSALSAKGAQEVMRRLRRLALFAAGSEPIHALAWEKESVGGCEGGRFTADRRGPGGEAMGLDAVAVSDGPVLYLIVWQRGGEPAPAMAQAFARAVESFVLARPQRADPGAATGR